MAEVRSVRTDAAPEALTAEKLTLERRYTTKDFTALRAYVQRIAPAVIARTYYDPDDDPHAATPGAMERHLNTMLDSLVALALANRAWAGIEAFTDDELPVISASRKASNLCYSFGYSASGFQLGQGCGKLVSELMLDGAPSISLDPFAIDRFERNAASSVTNASHPLTH